MKLNLIRPSSEGSEGETRPGKTAMRGDFPLSGGGCWGMALPDARHINTECKGPLGHLGHMRSRISEAQVKVLIAGPAVSLVGRL